MLVTDQKLLNLDVGTKVSTFVGRGIVVGYIIPVGFDNWRIGLTPMHLISYAVRIMKFKTLDGEYRKPQNDGEYLKMGRFDVKDVAYRYKWIRRFNKSLKVMTKYGLGRIIGREKISDRFAVRILDRGTLSATMRDLQETQGALCFYDSEISSALRLTTNIER
jgi:hypothetical protein